MSSISMTPETQYKLVDKLSTVGIAIATRTLFKESWKAVKKRRPPENPNDGEVDWSDAAMWGASVGLGVGLTKVLMKMALDAGWQKYIGRKPADE